jgi:uncharacterized membrane protein YhiD involved in acid resistance
MDRIFNSLNWTPEHSNPLDFVLRMLVAILLGTVISWLYGHVRSQSPMKQGTFPATLIMLCTLIAMVTYVIGDNIARAFSLVGAISIVRFRTVVEDTYDITFVIFAVVVGMAVGSGHYLETLLGCGLVAVTAWSFRPRENPGKAAVVKPSTLKVRTGIASEIPETLDQHFPKFFSSWYLVEVESSRGGQALDRVYRIVLLENVQADSVIAELLRLEGVQSVDWNR